MAPSRSWFAEAAPDGSWRVFDRDSVIIASHCVMEDARLMAAAPDLLAACRDALRLIYTHKEALASLDGFSDAYDRLSAAIDKAMPR